MTPQSKRGWDSALAAGPAEAKTPRGAGQKPQGSWCSPRRPSLPPRPSANLSHVGSCRPARRPRPGHAAALLGPGNGPPGLQGRPLLPHTRAAPLGPGRWDGISEKLPAPQKHTVHELAAFPFGGKEGVLGGGNRDQTLTPSGQRHTQWTSGAGQGLHPDPAPTKGGGTGEMLLGREGGEVSVGTPGTPPARRDLTLRRGGVDVTSWPFSQLGHPEGPPAPGGKQNAGADGSSKPSSSDSSWSEIQVWGHRPPVPRPCSRSPACTRPAILLQQQKSSLERK